MRGKIFLAAAATAAIFTGYGGPVILPLAAQEPEAPRTLMPGKGVDLANARCVICHDAQHITRAKLSRDEWAFNIKNMIERGAPITPEEVAPILEYLATYYNRDSPPPAAEPMAAGETASAAVDPAQQLLSTNACIGCHALDRKLVGPAFREIAQRYGDQSGAAELLAKKIREGGVGAWGQTPMPAHRHLAETDVALLAQWIIQQR